jgi:hypothetical protein
VDKGKCRPSEKYPARPNKKQRRERVKQKAEGGGAQAGSDAGTKDGKCEKEDRGGSMS